MTKVITYGTYDMLHRGHIRLLQRAKAMGDYLIVGVTAEAFDRARGKLNVKQSTMDRVMAVKALGIADQIIIEEYEGQKIDDILRYDVDIFTVGSDWTGKFDYLRAYCQVVYLPRTEGISSSALRAEERSLRLGIVGELPFLAKFEREAEAVNGLHISGLCTQSHELADTLRETIPFVTDDYGALLGRCDAVYLISPPQQHEAQIRRALAAGKHVLCESPVTLDPAAYDALRELAAARGCILMEAQKTAYTTAYYRLLLLVKSGRIGRVVSIDATCTSLRPAQTPPGQPAWNSIEEWGVVAMPPVFQLLGTSYAAKQIVSRFVDEAHHRDDFTRISFLYPDAVATVCAGNGVKAEGDMVIAGTKGYIYVPAPWWKTDYFEIRYENPAENKRYFYALEGEGIRYEQVSFLKSVQTGKAQNYITPDVTRQMAAVLADFYRGTDVIALRS